MPQNSRDFTVTDPRSFDGNPFEVAQRACAQAEAVARILAICVGQAATMARNAQMERNLQETRDDARASEWEDSLQSRTFSKLLKQSKEVEAKMGQLGAASGFNPKAPLPKD